jgi:hypothetical protein
MDIRTEHLWIKGRRITGNELMIQLLISLPWVNRHCFLGRSVPGQKDRTSPSPSQ